MFCDIKCWTVWEGNAWFYKFLYIYNWLYDQYILMTESFIAHELSSVSKWVSESLVFPVIQFESLEHEEL